jgi:hypothetical protein
LIRVKLSSANRFVATHRDALPQKNDTQGGVSVPCHDPVTAVRVLAATHSLAEVKNVASMSYSNQLRDFYWYANSTGRSFNLVVRVNTSLSPRVQVMVDAVVINLDPILPAR